MYELLQWRRSRPSPQQADPFAPDAPSFATVYEHDNYHGASTRIECCSPVTTGGQMVDPRSGAQWSGVSSIRVTPGTRLFLYESPDCSGASFHFVSNIHSLSQTGYAHLNDRVGCIRLQRLDSSAGVVVYPDSEYRGEGQLFPVGSFDGPSLYADNQASSVWIGQPFQVTLRDGGLQQPGHAVVLHHSIENLYVLGINDRMSSIIVEHACSPACVHGSCLGHNRCHCHAGWSGTACDLAMADASSFVVCDRKEYFLGETMRCVLHARREGQSLVTVRSAFQITQMIPSVPRASGSAAESGIEWVRAEDHQAAQFEFTFRAASLSPSLLPQQLLRARINLAMQFPPPPGVADQHALPHANLVDLQTNPSVTVFPHPDATSVLQCAKQRALLHERISCTLTPRLAGAALTTLTRAFTLASSDPGVAQISKLLAPIDAKSKRKNDRVGSSFVFTYTAVQIASASSKSRGNNAAAAAGKNTLNALCGWAASGPPVPACFAPLSLTMNHAPPSENDYFAQAKQLVFQRAFLQAFPLLKRALQFQPLHVKEVLLLRSDLYVLFGRYKQARGDLNLLQRLAKGERVELPAAKAEGSGDVASSSSSNAIRIESAKPDHALVRRVAAKRAILTAAESQQNRGMLAHAMSQWHVSAHHLSEALEASKYSEFLHLLRAECALELGEYNLLKYDVVSILAFKPFHAQAIHLLSKGYYLILGNLDGALANLKLCMRHAPATAESGPTPCEKTFAAYSAIADATARVDELARAGSWEAAALAAELAMDLDRVGPSARNLLYKQCGFYARANSSSLHTKTVSVCSDGLKTLKHQAALTEKAGLSANPQDREYLFSMTLDRGWAFHSLGKHEAALSDLKACIGLSMGSSHPLSARLESLNAALNTAKESRPVRDFYEVLGLDRSASKQDIKRAYRKLALRWHPDKNDAPEAAALFLELTEAFSILYDEETRAKYDSGSSAETLRKEQQAHAQQRPSFNFNFGEFTEDGRVKAWFTNADGEREETEFDTAQSQQKKQQEEAAKKAKADEEKKKEIPKHCCLPLGQGE